MAESTNRNPNQAQINFPDEPPPAYENNQSSSSDVENGETIVIEPPPPYFPVDPSKTEQCPRYAEITPVELIEIQRTNFLENGELGQRATINDWLISDSNLNIGSDCAFISAFLVAFFFNWFGFLLVVCFIPTIAARFGAMSGFGLSVIKWISVLRFHEFRPNLPNGEISSMKQRENFQNDPIQIFVLALLIFAGFFLFIRGLVSYIMIKNRARQHQESTQIFSWY